MTVLKRLRAAAARRGMAVAFRRTRGAVLRFQVVAAADVVPTKDAAPVQLQADLPAPPAAAPRRGRPRRTTA